MKIHLIKSIEVDRELFTRVIDLLEAVPGPVQFAFDRQQVIDFDEDELFQKHIPGEEGFEKMEFFQAKLAPCYFRAFPMERTTATWETLFAKCRNYRRDNHIANDEFVLLLTATANRENWFASLDEQMPYNGFIHTADWDHYIDCYPAFPIAYEVVALMLQKHVFKGRVDLRQAVHEKSIGCVNDMCIQKRDIILKLRTADTCRSCLEKMKETVSMTVIQHALKLMESLRVKMLYAQNFRQESPLSRLLIDDQKRIFLADFGNIEIRLRPLEKALYLLFLQHPEGILLSCLSDHRQQLCDIYMAISNMGERAQMQNRINDMANVLNNSANEKISRIKRVFEEAIGEELAKHYYIRGQVAAVKKIALAPGLIQYTRVNSCL